MRLTTQFKRLNKLAGMAGVGARCAFCQFALRQTYNKSTHHKPNPDIIQVTCEWCGTKYGTPLPVDPVERAVTLEIAHDTVADSYATHRKCALHLWINYHSRVLKPKAKKKTKQQQTWSRQTQLTPAQKRRKEMEDAYIKLVSSAHRRARRAAPKFPDLDELLIAFQPSHYSSDETSDFGREMYFKDRTKQLDALAKLEKIIWNEPHSATLEAVAANAEQIAQHEREKTEKEAARLAEQEKRLREASEQHAALAARTSPATVESSKPADNSDFWSNPDLVRERRERVDAPASLVSVPSDTGETLEDVVARFQPTPVSDPPFKASRLLHRPYRPSGTPHRSLTNVVTDPDEDEYWRRKLGGATEAEARRGLRLKPVRGQERKRNDLVHVPDAE